jgi:hypothetical protein
MQPCACRDGAVVSLDTLFAMHHQQQHAAPAARRTAARLRSGSPCTATNLEVHVARAVLLAALEGALVDIAVGVVVHTLPLKLVLRPAACVRRMTAQ